MSCGFPADAQGLRPRPLQSLPSGVSSRADPSSLAPDRKGPAAKCNACHGPGHTYNGCACRTARRWCHGFEGGDSRPGAHQPVVGHHPHFGVGVTCGLADLVVIDIGAHQDRRLPPYDRLLPGIGVSEHVDLIGVTARPVSPPGSARPPFCLPRQVGSPPHRTPRPCG